MTTINKLVILIILSGAPITSFAQKNSWGIVYKLGFSLNNTPVEDQASILLRNPLLSSGAGFYVFVPFVKETSMSPIKTFKLSLIPIAQRSGYFEIDNTVVRIDRLFTDIELLLPIRMKYSPTSEIYLGVGPSVGILLNQEVNPDALVNVNKQILSPGIGFEFGFLFMGTSTAGIKTNSYFGEHPLTDISVFIGVGFDTIKQGVSNSIHKNH